ncbi:MAG: Gfo/Idh/MocA family protein [Planctomycetota bacterium]
MMNTKTIQRRDFLKSTIAAGAGLVVLPSGVLSGANAPSNKLNVALIGTWGRGDAHFSTIATENVIALCDVDENHIAHAAKRFPKAKHYVDWRKCLDQKNLDAVICCTTDHTHGFISNWTLNRGLHCYMETHSPGELPQAKGQTCYTGRHAAPCQAQLRARARAGQGRSYRRADRLLRMGQPPDSQEGLSEGQRFAAQYATL